MRIAAIFIPEGVIPHLFGEDHREITINFGGYYLYTIRDSEITNKPKITDKQVNPCFLDDVFGDKITLFSCIVGSNGGGKTSLLKQLVNYEGCWYVIEDKDNKCSLEDSLEGFHRVYYTPYLSDTVFENVSNNGKDLSKNSLIKLDNHIERDHLEDFLTAHFSEGMKRWVKFNHFFKGLDKKHVRVALPTFEKITLTLKSFDLTTTNTDVFHDTPCRLIPVIKNILEKIKDEKENEGNKTTELSNNGSNREYYLIVFQYRLYEIFLAKFVSILEHAGNNYLKEGIINGEYEEALRELDVRKSLEWLLNNTGVEKQEKYWFSEHLDGLKLIDYITGLLNTDRIDDNGLEIMVTESEALKIIELYDEFNHSFNNDWFKFDTKPMFGFKPHITVSSGEQSFLNLFSTLYFHAENIENKIDIDEHSFESLRLLSSNILLLLDEGDNAFHPQWKKTYVDYLREILPVIFDGFSIQVIITSHDPLTLSDLPKNNVVYLERDDGVTFLGNSENKLTFGANIADLLKKSFFIHDSQMGSFVARQINEVINDINNGSLPPGRQKEIKRIIKAIDEPVLKFKLAEMLSESLGNHSLEMELIDEEIKRLENKKKGIR